MTNAALVSDRHEGSPHRLPDNRIISLPCRSTCAGRQSAVPEAPPAAVDHQAFLRGFAQGAALPPQLLAATSPEVSGQMLGETLRAMTVNLMAALQDRAAFHAGERGG